MTKTTTIGIIALVALVALVVPAFAATSEQAIYSSKYVAIDNSVPNEGYLYVFDNVRNNVYSNAITIQPVESNAAIPITNGAKVTKEFVDLFTPSGEAINTTLGGSGNYDTPLAPGTYAVTLHYGQAGLPEYAMVKIVAGQRTDVMFLGTALSNGATTTITIIRAIYGSEKGAPVTITVTDTPAWDETVYSIVHYGQFTGYAKPVTHGQYDFVIGCQKYKIVGSGGFGVVKYLRNIVHHAAITHEETTYPDGNTVDVTAQVQNAVNNGYTKLYFDNGQNPGGIFAADGTTLLAQIDDPDPGVVKFTTITYSINGKTPVTVTGDERTVITL